MLFRKILIDIISNIIMIIRIITVSQYEIKCICKTIFFKINIYLKQLNFNNQSHIYVYYSMILLNYIYKILYNFWVKTY